MHQRPPFISPSESPAPLDQDRGNPEATADQTLAVSGFSKRIQRKPHEEATPDRKEDSTHSGTRALEVYAVEDVLRHRRCDLGCRQSQTSVPPCCQCTEIGLGESVKGASLMGDEDYRCCVDQSGTGRN